MKYRQQPAKFLLSPSQAASIVASDRDQRRALLEQVEVEAEPFVRVLCLLPLHPGAVAASTVGDFDKRTSEKFLHGIKVLMATNYIDNLSEEVRKGMLEKAEQGI